MIRIRPIVGAALATLMLVPMLGSAPTSVIAAEVELLPPGGGLTPPKEDPKPDTGTELPPEVGTGPADLGGGSSSDSQSSSSGGSSSDRVDTQPTLQTRHFGFQADLSCAVASTPNSIIVINRSAEPLPAGTRIKWQLKSEGKRGYFALLGPLGGGETLVADNVLDGTADQAADCVARVI